MRADLNPHCSGARVLVCSDSLQVSRAQDFQVPGSLQALTLGILPALLTVLSLTLAGLASFSPPYTHFRLGSWCLRPRSW